MNRLLRAFFTTFAGVLSLSGSGTAEELKKERRVMTWVPPYGVDVCWERLDQSFDGVGMKDGLTHLGLQFWHPTENGGIKLVERSKPIDESTISDFQKWGDAHGVQTMLCVYNGTSEGWDWELAKTAFDTHRGFARDRQSVRTDSEPYSPLASIRPTGAAPNILANPT